MDSQQEQQSQGAQAAAIGEKEKLLHLSEISLLLDTYEDIFSDFDPRSFSQRALSGDFLLEAQRASRESGKGTITLKLLIPKDKRNESSEAMIKKRLKEHFKKHSARIGKEIRDMVKNGMVFAALGTIVMLAASLVLFFYATASIFSSFLVVFLEPAGWFFFWEGLYQAMFESKKMKPDFEFYKKMAKCEISFHPY